MLAAELSTLDAAERRLGVIDIGSNSLRLVIFDGLKRMPAPIFNEKVLCGLGQGVSRTGRMEEARIEAAMAALRRFAAIAGELATGGVVAVATAAVRDAENGPAFAARVEAECGIRMQILTGEEEATLSALGVLSAEPEADGLMGDIGGSSLELVGLDQGRVRRQVTLPLGAFSLALGGDDPDDWITRVEEVLAGQRWLEERRGRPLYVVGGGWRAIARVHMAETNHPLQVIHRYTLPFAEALMLAERIARLDDEELRALKGAPSRRLPTLRPAAAALAGLLKQVRPRELVFSAYGLREGVLFRELPARLRADDPLMAACRSLANRAGGFAAYGDAVHQWIAPAFDGETDAEVRLRHAACLLSEIAVAAHPDHRGEQALNEILSLPYLPMSHQDRAFVALAVFCRYSGKINGAGTAAARALLAKKDQARARAVGLALRLADTFSGRAPALLERARLMVEDGILVMRALRGGDDLLGEVVERRLASLAKACALDAEVVDADAADDWGGDDA